MLKMMKIRSAETTRKKENEKFQIKIKLEKTEESLSEGADRLAEQGKELAKVRLFYHYYMHVYVNWIFLRDQHCLRWFSVLSFVRPPKAYGHIQYT